MIKFFRRIRQKLTSENKISKYNMNSVSTFKKHGNLRNIINTLNTKNFPIY